MASKTITLYRKVIDSLQAQGFGSRPIPKKAITAAFLQANISNPKTIRNHLGNMQEIGLLDIAPNSNTFFLGPSTKPIDIPPPPPKGSHGADPKLPPLHELPIRERLLAVMRTHPDKEHYTLWAARIRADPKSVNKTLKRMAAELSAPIVDEDAGYYRIAYGIDQLKGLENEVRVGLHGLKLEGRIKAELSTPIDKKNGGLSLLPPQKVKEYRKRSTFNDFDFKGYRITVTLHDCGLVEVFLNSSLNPISFTEFQEFTYFLQGKFSGFVEWKDWKVTQWGINADYNHMQLEGMKSVKLQVFRDAWFQIYQKREDMVRVEVHSTKSIQAADIYQLFKSLSDCANGSRPQPQPANEEQPYAVVHLPPSKWDVDPSYM